MLKCIHTKTKRAGFPLFFYLYILLIEIFHVKILCKEMPPTRHLDRSGEISTIICLQIIVSPVKDLYNKKNLYAITTKLSKRLFSSILYVSLIHLVLPKQNYEISPFR